MIERDPTGKPTALYLGANLAWKWCPWCCRRYDPVRHTEGHNCAFMLAERERELYEKAMRGE